VALEQPKAYGMFMLNIVLNKHLPHEKEELRNRVSNHLLTTQNPAEPPVRFTCGPEDWTDAEQNNPRRQHHLIYMAFHTYNPFSKYL